MSINKIVEFYNKIVGKYNTCIVNVECKDEFIIRLGYLILKIRDNLKSVDNVKDLSEYFFNSNFQPSRYEEDKLTEERFLNKIKKFIISNVGSYGDTYPIKIQLICDRQYLIEEMKSRQIGIMPYMLDRLDMYRVTITYKGHEISYFAEPCYDGNEFKVSFDCQLGNEYSTKKTRKIVEKHFSETEEYQNMKKWTILLYDAGYFRDGRHPGQDTYLCQHCHSTFKNGSKHEHIKYDGRIIHHHGKAHAELKRLGITLNSISCFKESDPSLEDDGLLK